jgi:glyoxylase-like metal-dependent hydrolase (beta-lactamase superfamily II)
MRASLHDEAARWLCACARRRPDDIAVWRARLDWAVATNRVAEAREAMGHLPATTATPTRVQKLAADLAGRRGDLAAERNALEPLAALDPTDSAAINRLIELAVREGQSDRAAELRLQEAAIDRLEAQYKEGYRRNQPRRDAAELGHLAEQLGRVFEASAWLTIAIAVAPARDDVRRDLNRLNQHALATHKPGRTLADVLRAELEIAAGSPKARSALSTVDLPLLGRAAVTIVPGIHMLGGLSPSAAYVVETSDGLVLVDSGLESEAGRLKQQMAELGLDWRNVRAILLTHVHGDHCGGAEHLRAATGARVYAGQGDAAILRAGQPREAFFSTFHMPNESPHATTVDIELKGDETVPFGNDRFHALAAPGHTPGSICYLMERENLRVLFAGDVIMMLLGDETPHSELRKPLGTYAAYLPPRYRGDAKDYLSSLHGLRKLPAPDLVLPGHPGADSSPQSPALSQARWEALLEQGIRDMEQLLRRFASDGADFLDGHPKRLLPDLYYLGDFQGSAVYGFHAASKFFVVDAPGGPGLFDFLNVRLQQLGVKPQPPAAVLLTSCGAEAAAGLKELVEKCHVQVVASPAGLPSVTELCPAETSILSAENWSEKVRFSMTTIPLRGRGLAPIAYRIRLGDKSILFAGRIPIKVNPSAGIKLFSDFLEARGNVQEYLESLNELRDLKPDLWLPATASDGQNANLYDDQWEQILADNRAIIHKNARQLGLP